MYMSCVKFSQNEKEHKVFFGAHLELLMNFIPLGLHLTFLRHTFFFSNWRIFVIPFSAYSTSTVNSVFFLQIH